MAKSTFVFNVNSVLRGLEAVDRKMKAGVQLYGETAALRLESYAKSNRPWTDRTSHAKQSIKGTARMDKEKLVISLSGGMEYSPYLEFAHNKRYAILYPTLREKQSEVLGGFKNLLGR